MTYKQATDQGWQVRKGEKGTQIEFWDVKPASAREEGQPQGRIAGAENRPKQPACSRLIHRVYTVFNASQIDGIPAYTPKSTALRSSRSRRANPRQLRRHESPMTRRIALSTADEPTASTCHPKTHSRTRGLLRHGAPRAGALDRAPSRLNRSTLNEVRFGDQNYAKEELRAELASVFIAAEKGIPHDPAQHAAYVGSWISALKQDKNEIFRAAHDASAATDFLLGLRARQFHCGPGARAGAGEMRQQQEPPAPQNSRKRRGSTAAARTWRERPGHLRACERAIRRIRSLPRDMNLAASTIHVEDKHTGTDRRTRSSHLIRPQTSEQRQRPINAKTRRRSLRAERKPSQAKHLGNPQTLSRARPTAAPTGDRHRRDGISSDPAPVAEVGDRSSQGTVRTAARRRRKLSPSTTPKSKRSFASRDRGKHRSSADDHRGSSFWLIALRSGVRRLSELPTARIGRVLSLWP